ncbi:hypothetical protein V1478_009760 [Vespula squamosa]|uniref:Uncharacterized protein n=1 Tax=Vespula squamosa TaxID=30214 RepID=A0ABD2AJB3_VESSQ
MDLTPVSSLQRGSGVPAVFIAFSEEVTNDEFVCQRHLPNKSTIEDERRGWYSREATRTNVTGNKFSDGQLWNSVVVYGARTRAEANSY